MRENPLTADILIATIKRSALPTIFVESKDDAIIYRGFESFLGIGKIDFIQCGGRNTVLKIYERRNELSSKKIKFIADRDMWVFTSVPAEYLEVIFTQGYSIENDLYTDGEQLL